VPLKNILIVLLLFFSIITSATDYYISSSGNDANNGLSSSTPWKTIAKVNASSFLPGDTIFFKRGDTWREQLIVSSSGKISSYIVFTSYGAGLAPKILGSTIVTTWTRDAGNIWYSNDTVSDPYNTGTYGNVGNIFFKELNGDLNWGRVKKVTKEALAIEYDWIWISNHIYIYSPTDPNIRYSCVEVTQRQKIIDINNAQYITFDGIEIAYAAKEGIAEASLIENHSGLVIKNCHIHHIGVKNSLAAYGMEVWHSDMLIQNNTIHDCGRRSISLNIYKGNLTVNNIVVEQNILYHGFHTTGVDINTELGTLNNLIIRNNLIYDDVTETLDGVESYGSIGIFAKTEGGSISNLYIYNNLLLNTTSTAIQIDGILSSYIYNNTIYGINPNLVEGNGIYLGSGTNYILKNNIIYSNAVSVKNPGYRSLQIIDATGTVISDYNLFYCTDAAAYPIAWRSRSYNTSEWDIYKLLTGQDLHSPYPTNPRFISSSDYHLQLSSPAIDAGTDVGLPYSGKAPDLGAYETQAASSIPRFISSCVENANPSLLELTYDLNLNNLVIPAPSSFNVLVNSISRTVNLVTISATKVQLTLASPVVYSDIITVDYTKPSTNPLQTTSGGQAASFIAQTVANNVASLTLPIYVSSSIENATPSLLVITYDMALANLVPAASAFSVHVNSAVRTVNAVAVSGTKVQLILASPIVYGNVVTFSYTKPSSNPLRSTSGGIAASISNQTVDNNCSNIAPTINQPPVVEISNPLKGNEYETNSTITLEAIASDPDGSISKVEFYNGAVKLVELTAAPYIYTWKDVAAGNYSITAVAMDNLNASTTSLPLEFEVGTIIKYDANSDIINLYPNPNDGHFSIEFINPLQNDKSNIVITDLAGKQVYNGTVLKEETLKQFDLSNIKSGIYVMMIICKELLVTKKFIIN
jgi:uncharacterized repeat protein (TIGR02059 family)